MPRIAYLVGVSLAAAATSTTNCSAASMGSTTVNCQSCTMAAGATVCTAAYAAIARPDCVTLCSLVPLTPPPVCNSTPTTNPGSSGCGVCIPALTGSVGLCVSTSQAVGFALSTSSALDFEASATVNSNIQAFASSSTAVSVVVDGSSSANGTVTSDNAVVQVTGSAVANLTVGSASSSSSLAFVTLNQQGAVTVTAWKNNAAAAKVDNNAALTVNWLTVGNTWFSVWHNTSASASAGVTFQNIDFSSGYAVGMSYGSGTVHVAGGTVSVNGPGVKGSGTLKLTGGASVSSTGGSLQGVTIDISSQGQSAPVAVVDTTLDTSGDITASAGTSGSTGMTSSSAATLVVNGQLTLSATSSKVQPKVVVSGSANSKLTINSNASSFTANDVWVGANGYLELGANTYAAAQQGKVMFNNLWLDAQGNVKLTQSVAANAASKAGNAVIAFNYSASVNVTALAQATVWLVDSTGVSVKLATSASATMGRRLLAGSSTATWGSNGMSYSYAGSGGSSANGAVKSFVAVPIVVISLCGLMM